MELIMYNLRFVKKIKFMNSLEKIYIYPELKIGNGINEESSVGNNNNYDVRVQ